jgi:hypothetical protein
MHVHRNVKGAACGHTPRLSRLMLSLCRFLSDLSILQALPTPNTVDIVISLRCITSYFHCPSDRIPSVWCSYPHSGVAVSRMIFAAITHQENSKFLSYFSALFSVSAYPHVQQVSQAHKIPLIIHEVRTALSNGYDGHVIVHFIYEGGMRVRVGMTRKP